MGEILIDKAGAVQIEIPGLAIGESSLLQFSVYYSTLLRPQVVLWICRPQSLEVESCYSPSH